MTKTRKSKRPLARDVPPIMVRPRTLEQRETLTKAAKAAGVSLSYYLLESALMVAAEEGFTAPAVERGPKWSPRRSEPFRIT